MTNVSQKNNILITLIVILSILLIITIGYIVYDKTISGNNLDNQVSENENDIQNEEPKEQIKLSEGKAKELYNRVVVDPVIEYVLMSLDKGVNFVDEMSLLELGALIKANAKGDEISNKFTLCGTEHENKLRQKGVITDLNGCDVPTMTLDNMKSVVSRVLGDTFVFSPKEEIIKNNNGDSLPNVFYYYEAGKVALLTYPTAGYASLFSLDDYYVKDDIVTIEVESNDKEMLADSYKLNFKVVDNNYYLYSLERK